MQRDLDGGDPQGGEPGAVGRALEQRLRLIEMIGGGLEVAQVPFGFGDDAVQDRAPVGRLEVAQKAQPFAADRLVLAALAQHVDERFPRLA